MKRSLLYNAFVCTSLVTLVSLLGCEHSFQKKQSPVNDKYSKFLSEIGLVKRPTKLIIVPTQGCGPCIKSAMDFLRDSVSSADMTVVISGPSKKSCSLLMRKFNFQRKDVIIDPKTRARSYGIITIYPVVLSSNDDKWESVEITPANYDSALMSR